MFDEVKMVYQTAKGVWKIDGYYYTEAAIRFMNSLKTPNIKRIELRDMHTNKVIKFWDNPRFTK